MWGRLPGSIVVLSLRRAGFSVYGFWGFRVRVLKLKGFRV